MIFFLGEQFGDPRLCGVDAIEEDESGDFAGFGTRKLDVQADLEKHLLDVAEVVILWGSDDACKRCNIGDKLGGDFRC